MRDTDAPLEFLHLGLIDYVEAWERQRALAHARAQGMGPDTVLLLEHPPVYTAGKRTEPHDRPTDGTPVIDVDRGGRITWHGPGQLVGYPIIKLAEPIDVVGYVRLLEAVLIAACGELGLTTERVAGRSGVWVRGRQGKQDRKVAAIGVRVTRGVTMHGFALNCDPDLDAFGRIVPCGITDAGVTSLSAELDRDVTVSDATPVVLDGLRRAFAGAGGAAGLERDAAPTARAPREPDLITAR